MTISSGARRTTPARRLRSPATRRQAAARLRLRAVPPAAQRSAGTTPPPPRPPAPRRAAVAGPARRCGRAESARRAEGGRGRWWPHAAARRRSLPSTAAAPPARPYLGHGHAVSSRTARGKGASSMDAHRKVPARDAARRLRPGSETTWLIGRNRHTSSSGRGRTVVAESGDGRPAAVGAARRGRCQCSRGGAGRALPDLRLDGSRDCWANGWPAGRRHRGHRSHGGAAIARGASPPRSLRAAVPVTCPVILLLRDGPAVFFR